MHKHRSALIMGLAALASSATLVATAAAQSFDGTDVEGFIGMIEAGETLSKQFPEEQVSIQEELDFNPQDFGALLDENGEFRVFRIVAEAMQARPDEPVSRAYADAVRENGFDGLSDYGEKADAIAMAYFASQMNPKDMAQLDQMTPQMMAMMPPQMRAQMESAMDLLGAIEDVPERDIATLKPYQKKLRKAMR